MEIVYHFYFSWYTCYMKSEFVDNLRLSHPLLLEVLRVIGEGGVIDDQNPLWGEYLLARQLGLVTRTGEDRETIKVSPKGWQLQGK